MYIVHQCNTISNLLELLYHYIVIINDRSNIQRNGRDARQEGD